MQLMLHIENLICYKLLEEGVSMRDGKSRLPDGQISPLVQDVVALSLLKAGGIGFVKMDL